MIIGLIGFKRVGKSTAAEYLHKQYLYDRVNFKDGMLAKMLEDFPDFIPALCRLMEKHYWDGKAWTFERLNREKPEVWRTFMVNYGTDLWRVIENNIWVRKWGERAEDLTNVVADDVRFINEANKVKEVGGILIRLIRPDITTGGAHASETEQLEIVADYTIEVGEGEQEELFRQHDAIIDKTHT